MSDTITELLDKLIEQNGVDALVRLDREDGTAYFRSTYNGVIVGMAVEFYEEGDA